MPSDFSGRIASNFDLLYVKHGVPGVYTAADGTETSGTIRIHRNESSQQVRDNKVSGETQTADIYALKSEFIKPVRGGRFLVDGIEVWTVEKMPLLRNGQWTVTCTRSASERAMEGRAKSNA